MTRTRPTATQTTGRTSVATGLTNHPCNVKITISVDNGTPEEFSIDNEAEARNWIARHLDKAVIQSNPTTVLSHIDDSSQPIADYLLCKAVEMGLSLPTEMNPMVAVAQQREAQFS